MADWLALSRPHLSKELVDDEAFDRLLQMGRHLPGDVMAAIEVRLGPGKAPVDLAVRLTEPWQGLQITPHLPAPCNFLEQLFRDWADGTPSTRGFHSLWLELDVAQDPGAHLPDPILCVRLQRSVKLEQVMDDLLPRLHGSPLSSSQKQLFRTAWMTIPKGCIPLYVFSLRGRRAQAIRLETYGEDLETILAWPRLARHPGASKPLKWIRFRIPALENADRFHVSLNIGAEGWSPQIGLEASFQHQPHREPGWGQWLDDLVDRGLCDSCKREGLERWTGQTRFGSGKLVRALSHVKLSFPGDEAVDAKGYLMLQHLPTESTRIARGAGSR